MFSPDNLVVQPQYKSSFLPQVSTTRVALQLGCGAMVWLAVRSVLYYGSRGLVSKYILDRKKGMENAVEDGKVFAFSMAADHVFSCCCCPITYLAGSFSPRFLLDYVFTWWSEYLCLLDRFSPRDYVSFSNQAFETRDEWNFGFFTWQLPSAFLTLGKLAFRCFCRGRKEAIPTKVIGVVGIQLFLRAYISSFSVMLPDSSLSALEVIVCCLLDSAIGRYLAFQTYPFSASPLSSPCDEKDKTQTIK